MCNLSGTFCFDKSLFFCSEFLQNIATSWVSFDLCSKQEHLKFLCWSKKVLKNFYTIRLNTWADWLQVWNESKFKIYALFYWVMTIFTSCHFACMHQRGVPAILMAYDITKFIIFFFILIQSCKITIYIFHLEELGD